MACIKRRKKEEVEINLKKTTLYAMFNFEQYDHRKARNFVF